MPALSAFVSSIVLLSADVCADPIPGGAGEPDFCAMSEPALIQTPYFSFEAQSGVLVGVDQGGKRVVVQASVRQSLVSLSLQAHPMNRHDAIAKQFGKCGSLSAESDTELVCDLSDERIVRLRKLLVGTRSITVAELGASQLAFEQLPLYEKMLESVAAE